MRFAHLKVQHGFERMRLRGLTGARDEFISLPLCRTSRRWRCVSSARQQAECAVDCVKGLRLVVVSPIRLRRPARNKPKTPPDSKTNYITAFFDSIDPSRTGRDASWGRAYLSDFLSEVLLS